MENKRASHKERLARRKRLTERLQALRQRLHLLENELKDYTSDFYRVCIFGSARIKPDDDIYKLTYELGRGLGEEGIDVLTGGRPRVNGSCKPRSFGWERRIWQ